MRNRVPVVFALLASLLVVTAAPASASPTLAVASQNTTTTDLSNATELTNLSVSNGTASLARVAVEDFEDGDITVGGNYTGWSGDTGALTAQSQRVLSGSVSAEFTGTNGDRVSIARTPATTRAIRARIEINDTTANSGDITVLALAEGGTDFAQVQFEGDGGVVWKRFGSPDTALGNWSANTTYTVTVVPNYTTDTADVYLNDTQVGAGVQLRGNESGTDEIAVDSVNTPATAYIDDITEADGPPVESATYRSQNHSVDAAAQAAVNLTLANATATITVVDTDTSTTLNQTTVSSTANHTLELADSSGDTLRTRVNVSAKRGKTITQLHDESILFDPAAPTATNATPPDNSTLRDSTPTFEINITDGDFATAQGDSVTAELYIDGSLVGTDVRTANGTAAVTASVQTGGDHTYHWEMTDTYGETVTTPNRTVTVPSELVIRNESAPSQTITTSGSAEVRFFGAGASVYSRPITNGTVSFDGLPANQQFTAVVDANGYNSRRVIIPSLFTQQTAYVLPDGANSVEVVFEIESPTGQFPPEETILYVEKPITLNNTTEYRTVAADTFGATGQFPVDMIPGERYRLRVESVDGSNSRVLGAYVPVASRVETLPIQRVEPRSDADAGQVVYGGLTSFNNASAIAVRHRDLGDSVDSVEYRIEYANGTVAVPNTTETADEFAAVYLLNLTNQTNVTVFYEAQLADGSTVSGSFSTGVVAGPVGRFGADAQVLSIVSWVAILATMGLLVIVNTDIAPVGGVAVATGLTILGTVAIPLPILGLSGVLAALNAFGGGVGR